MREFALKPVLARNIIIMFMLVLASFGCGYSSQPNWKPAEASHNIIDANLLKVIWYHSNVFIDDYATLGLAASNNKVFILGSMDASENSSVNALDVFTGESTWKSGVQTLFTVFADDTGVYVGASGGGGKVTSYDPGTGKVLWSRNFWDSGGVLHLITYEGQLHAYLSPDKHKILNTSDGKTVFSMFPNDPPFFDSGVCGIAYQTPIYTSDTIYYRTNQSEFKGEICAVDISTGELRWKSDLGVISNIVAKDDVAFVLVERGDLLALNPSNGETIANLGVSFDNKPFVLYSTRTTAGSFFLAYDSKNDILFTYLGDSRQLFAFAMVKK